VGARQNEIYFKVVSQAQSNVLYFPGDIQNYKNQMVDPEWKLYSYENTVDILTSKFPQSNIFIVRPGEIEGLFSHYIHLTHPGEALLHLISLLSNLFHKINSDLGLSCYLHPIILTAFSRGVLVLNHILSEYATLKLSSPYVLDWQGNQNGIPIVRLPQWEPNLLVNKSQTPSKRLLEHKDQINEFMDKITAVHYIDGHRFPTESNVCKIIAELTQTKSLYIHATPRQLDDELRQWIRDEYQIFINSLGTSKYFCKKYFPNEPRSLKWHFQTLDEFTVDPL